MPKQFWFFALHHAAQVLNYCPCKKNDTLTSSFALINQRHPDFRVIFHLFSVGFFRHMTYGPCAHTQFESHTQTGIAIGRSPDSNAMKFYHPVTKEIYTSADFKPDSSQTTSVVFHNSSMMVGLLLDCTPTIVVLVQSPSLPIWKCSSLQNNKWYKGMSLPLLPIPSNDPSVYQTYTICLPSGEHAEVGQAKLHTSHDASTSLDEQGYHGFRVFPPWISRESKITLEVDGAMVQGYLAFDAHNHWCFE
jgi:hypothetical protein